MFGGVRVLRWDGKNKVVVGEVVEGEKQYMLVGGYVP